MQIPLDVDDLQNKEAAQRDQFVRLGNEIERAVRSLKPSNDLKFKLAQALSDAGTLLRTCRRSHSTRSPVQQHSIYFSIIFNDHSRRRRQQHHHASKLLQIGWLGGGGRQEAFELERVTTWPD